MSSTENLCTRRREYYDISMELMVKSSNRDDIVLQVNLWTSYIEDLNAAQTIEMSNYLRLY